MPATVATIDPENGAAATPKGRGTMAENLLDRRTKEWRRRGELIAAFTEALGGPSAIGAMLAAKVETAAELAVTAELIRGRFMAGDAVSADDVVRTANQAARAEKALGIEMRSKRRKGAPALSEYLSSRAAAA